MKEYKHCDTCTNRGRTELCATCYNYRNWSDEVAGKPTDGKSPTFGYVHTWCGTPVTELDRTELTEPQIARRLPYQQRRRELQLFHS